MGRDRREPADAGERQESGRPEDGPRFQSGRRVYRPVGDGAPSTPSWATVAGVALRQADAVVGKLGNPVGIASYKPYQSTGEDFLHNYIGMLGIPIDLHPSSRRTRSSCS